MKEQSLTRKRNITCRGYIILFSGILCLWPTDVRAWSLVEGNSVSGGLGFQAGLSRWAPGGFKWFNEYSRQINRQIWLNFQINTTAGDIDDSHCSRGADGQMYCSGGHWDGSSIELLIGPTVQFALRKIPLVIDFKPGVVFDVLFFERDYAGVAFAFQGGVGVHYFIMENLGVGAEFSITLGPAIMDDDVGLDLYSSIDLQLLGVEYRW